MTSILGGFIFLFIVLWLPVLYPHSSHTDAPLPPPLVLWRFAGRARLSQHIQGRDLATSRVDTAISQQRLVLSDCQVQLTVRG